MCRTEQMLDTLTALVGNSAAGKVYLFLTRHCRPGNALVCTLEVIAADLGMHERTIRRAVSDLEDAGYVLVARIGSAHAYLLHPEECRPVETTNGVFYTVTSQTLIGLQQNPGIAQGMKTPLIKPELVTHPPGAAPHD